MIYPVVAYGDKVLTTVAAPIEKGTDVTSLIDDMLLTMDASHGVGLAAPQIGKSLQLFVIDVRSFIEGGTSQLEKYRKAYLNPVIEIPLPPATTYYEEGCLSIPGIAVDVPRPHKIRIKFYDRQWNLQEEELEGMHARVVQHEYDHLLGKLLLDYLPKDKLLRLQTKLEAIKNAESLALLIAISIKTLNRCLLGSPSIATSFATFPFMKKLPISFHFIFMYCLAWCMLLNLTSCGCGNQSTNHPHRLSMAVTPDQLIGENITATLKLSLEDLEKATEVANFQLRITIESQKGGIGSLLQYVDRDNQTKTTKEIVEKLTHFTKNTSLGKTNQSTQINLKVLRGEGVTTLSYLIELLDEKNAVVAHTQLTWHMQKALTLVQSSPSNMAGENKEIRLTIHNPNPFPTEKGKLKLLVKRTIGKEATIDQAATTKDHATYEIALPSLAGEQKVEKVLVIDSKKDLKASFKVQLYYQDQPQGELATANWEQGMLLLLEVKATGNPRTLTCHILNKGTLAARGVQLQYRVKNQGIKLRGNVLEANKLIEKAVGNLEKGTAATPQDLGVIDFGTNDHLEIEFALAYDPLTDGKEERKNSEKETTPWQPHTFIPADVLLAIDTLYHDVEQGHIVYKISNLKGTEVADHVELYYENISSEKVPGTMHGFEHRVTLKGKTKGKEGKFTIAPGTVTEDKYLPIEFLKADAVRFNFVIVYKGKLLKHTIRQETFKAKDVLLKLVSQETKDQHNHIVRTGINKLLRFKVEAEIGPHSRPVNNIHVGHISVNIHSKTEGGFISYVGEEEPRVSLNVPNLNKEILLLIHPPQGAKEAAFDFQVVYAGKQQDGLMQVDWKEDQLEIKDFSSFIEDNQASFKIVNAAGTLDPNDYIIELSTPSQDEIQFQFIHANPGDSSPSLIRSLSGSLSETFYKSTVNQEGHRVSDTQNLPTFIGKRKVSKGIATTPINIKLKKNPHQLEKTDVILTIKRDQTILAKQTVQWKAQGISCAIPLTNTKLENDQKMIIPIKNLGKEVSMNDLRIQLSSQEHIKWQIGNRMYTGQGEVLVSQVISTPKSQLLAGDLLELPLSIIPLDDKLYAATTFLQLYHKEELLVPAKELIWLNSHLFEKELQAYEKKFKEICKDLQVLQNAQPLALFLAHPDQFDDYCKEVLNYQNQIEHIQKKMQELKVSPAVEPLLVNHPFFDQLVKDIDHFSIEKIDRHITDRVHTIYQQNVLLKGHDAYEPQGPEVANDHRSMGTSVAPTPVLEGGLVQIQEIIHRSTPKNQSPMNGSPSILSTSTLSSEVFMKPLHLEAREDSEEAAHPLKSHRRMMRSPHILSEYEEAVSPNGFGPDVDATLTDRRVRFQEADWQEIPLIDEMDEQTNKKIQDLLTGLEIIASMKQQLEKHSNSLGRVRNRLVDMQNIQRIETALKSAQQRHNLLADQLDEYEKQVVTILYEIVENCRIAFDHLQLALIAIGQDRIKANQFLTSEHFSLITIEEQEIKVIKSLFANDTMLDNFNTLGQTILSVHAKLNETPHLLHPYQLSFLNQLYTDLESQKDTMHDHTLFQVVNAIVERAQEDLTKVRETQGDAGIMASIKKIMGKNNYSRESIQQGVNNVILIFSDVLAFYQTRNDQEHLKQANDVFIALHHTLTQLAAQKSPKSSPQNKRLHKK
eukprot:gene575-720_t